MTQNEAIMMRLLTRRVRPILRTVVEGRFNSAKEMLLNDVRNHPISQYISSHAPCPLLNSSTGTLFGFIGFEEGTDPVSELIDFLDQTIEFIPHNMGKNKLFSSTVAYPSKGALDSREFHPVWIGRGWPLMIEEGISGLNHYINKPSKNSVSGEGIQIEPVVRSADFSGHPYLTPIFADFRKRLLLSS